MDIRKRISPFICLIVAMLSLSSIAYASGSLFNMTAGQSGTVTCDTLFSQISQTDAKTVQLSCATPTPVPTATPTPSLVWIRPQMTELGRSVGYVDTCVGEQYGCGTEPLFALEQCNYIAHGNDDDHVFWVGQLPTPTTIYGVRLHTWQGSSNQPPDLPQAETFAFRNTADTTADTDNNPNPPVLSIPPFVAVQGPTPFMQVYVMQAMPSPVTVSNIRIQANSEQSWVTIGDLEILTRSGTAGQPAC